MESASCSGQGHETSKFDPASGGSLAAVFSVSLLPATHARLMARENYILAPEYFWDCGKFPLRFNLFAFFPLTL